MHDKTHKNLVELVEAGPAPIQWTKALLKLPLQIQFLKELLKLASEKFCNWIIMRRSVNLRSE